MTAVLMLTIAVGQISVDDAKLGELASVAVTPAKVERKRQFVHIADYPFVPRDAYATDLKSQDAQITDDEIDAGYRKHIAAVKRVQAEQRTLLTYLIDRQKVRAVHQQGLTDRDKIAFAFLVASLRRTNGRDNAQWLRIGAAGQLTVDRKLATVIPAEDMAAHEAANPVNGSNVELIEKLQQRRCEAIVSRLERQSFAVIVLSNAHDLSNLVADDTELVRLTVPAIRELSTGE